FPDCSRPAAKRKERRFGCGLRRSGQPDSVWSAGRGLGACPGDDLVCNYFHVNVDHSFDFCSAEIGPHVCALRSKTVADKIAARPVPVRTADGSAKPGSKPEIN